MTRPRQVPLRSCVACRQARPKVELLRIVRTPLGEVHADASGKLAGRGAYLCRNERCVEQAIKQKKLGRALGVSVGAEVLDEIRARLEVKAESELSGR